MPSPGSGVQQTHVTVRVAIRDVPSKGVTWREVPSGEFEAGERGVQIGPVFVPRNHVMEYDWIVRQEASAADPPSDAARFRIRVVVDDGTPDGKTHDVSGGGDADPSRHEVGIRPAAIRPGVSRPLGSLARIRRGRAAPRARG